MKGPIGSISLQTILININHLSSDELRLVAEASWKRAGELLTKKVVQKKVVVAKAPLKKASAMKKPLSKEATIAKKPALKPGDKRLSPKFIAHLRRLAKARKVKAAAERKAKELKKQKVIVAKVDKKQVKKAAQENAVKTDKIVG